MQHYLTLMRLVEHFHQIERLVIPSETKALLFRDLRRQLPPAQLLPTAEYTHQWLLSTIDAAIGVLSAPDRTDSPGETPKDQAPRKARRPAKA
jgi:hypothetical protein